ncbi:hypothetical protein QM012_007107 [Aureobasidium pullulans]|uniref:Uncharacterized protein n=1 Tax=Aureobasidium pullulans TaxID=5580 RepID=A0ABR0TNJ7_AURPU
MSQYQQDELARLFAHNMSLNQTLPQSTPDKQFLGHTAQPIYYSSQHYTPMSYMHVSAASEQQQVASPRADSPLSGSPLDSNSNNMTPIHLASMLRNHDIDPTSLSNSQVKLFTNADYEQRLRLLELWRISPPRPSHQWQQETSMAHEEQLAALRYEERMRAQVDDAQAEPYMESGYAHSAHSEPVYASCSGGLWRSQVEQHDRSKEMEDAHASWAQARNFEQLQAMNAQIEQQRGFASHDVASYDDDMEL